MPLKQETRQLAIHTALGPDVLAVRTVGVQEHMSRLFQINAELSSEDAEIDFDRVVGHPAAIRLELGQRGTRYFHGVINRFVQVANEGAYAHYRASIVPWLWLLTRTSNCRIFQHKKVPEIVEEIFREHGFSDFKLKLSGSYASKEFCVQYRETDFNFVSRLMEQEGMYYFFEHLKDKHFLVIADSTSAHTPFLDYSEVNFHEIQRGAPTREVITDWVVEKEVQPVAYALKDFDFLKPKTPLLSKFNVTRQYGEARFEIYDSPGEYLDSAEGDRLATVRLEELQAQLEILRGQANARGLAAGSIFTLKNHPRADQTREYLVTGVSLQADAGEYGSTPPGGDEFFHCTFTAIDSQYQFRPPRLTPRPVVQGPQTAIVVGPAGEEIHTDAHARVKVQFHWDRYGHKDENSSCWIRVSHANAGKGWGSMITPRIGQEVIVDFLEGDPDRPIITGRVYNADQKPPYAGGQGVVSGLKSNTHKGKGSNEMSMDDTAGKEKVTIHSQYDMSTTVEHDDTQTIHNDRSITVDGKHTETIKKNTTIHITEGDLDHKVIAGKADYSVEKTQATTVKLQIKDESTTADILQMAKDKIRLDSGAGKSTAELRPNGEIEISSAEQIKLITGDSSITLKKDGTITISGKKITISGTDETSMGVGNQNVKCDKTMVGTSGAAINSSATGKHEISGAMVKIN